MNEQNKVTLQIQISIRQESSAYNGLNLTDIIELPQKSFLEMCQILGQFEELSKKFKK